MKALKKLPDNSIDSIVTDPPYGLSFMGKKWDYDVPSVEIWRECLRVLKPGGHLLSFGGTRTYHRMVVNIEDAGFEIRDCIQWLYGSGFPKSTDVSKRIDKEAGAERETYERPAFGSTFSDDNGTTYGTAISNKALTPEAIKWSGWGTALKPANEPIVMARKPLEPKLTVADNVMKYGTGALNIDASRIGYTSEADRASATPQGKVTSKKPEDGYAKAAGVESERHEIERPELKGRWPANIILDEEAAAALDWQSGVLKSGGFSEGTIQQARDPKSKGAEAVRVRSALEPSYGGASRFFYVAKASKSERGTDNTHPTVKPIKLMQYLIKLVTPPNGIVLDPFMGSGTTGVAAKSLNYNFIGIERDLKYFEISKERLKRLK